jgi:hypothetical protein
MASGLLVEARRRRCGIVWKWFRKSGEEDRVEELVSASGGWLCVDRRVKRCLVSDLSGGYRVAQECQGERFE